MGAWVFAVGLSMAVTVVEDGGPTLGWYVSGKQTSAYEVSTPATGRCGASGAQVRSRAAGVKGPLAMMQTFQADAYRGARVRFAATVDTRDVKGWAGLFLRADGTQRTLVFDDMSTRPLRGNVACQQVYVVANVPPEATLLSVGVALTGEGDVDVSNVKLERVGDDVPLTMGVEQFQGRVDDVWFTADTVSRNNDGTLRVPLQRQSPGVWSAQGGDAEVIIDGREIHAKLVSVEGERTVTRSGVFDVTHRDGVTWITGRWGAPQFREPVEVKLTRTTLDLRWGFYERHLVAEPAPQLQAGCVFYAQRAGPAKTTDQLELCGAVLSPTPPPAQVVMAFLMEGFRRLGTGLPPPSPAAPPLPPRAPRR